MRHPWVQLAPIFTVVPGWWQVAPIQPNDELVFRKMPDDDRYPSQLAERFQIRLPDGMRERLKTEAEANKRSMNAEIIARLESSLATAAPDPRVLFHVSTAATHGILDVLATLSEIPNYDIGSIIRQLRDRNAELFADTGEDMEEMMNKWRESRQVSVASRGPNVA